MKIPFSLLLAVLPLSLQAAAPMVTNIAKFPSAAIAYTNYSGEVIVTNGITLGGVRNTSWPSTSIWTNSASRVRLVITNANSVLELQGNDGAGGGTVELWAAGTKQLTLSTASLSPDNVNQTLGTSLSPFATGYFGDTTGIYLGRIHVSAGASSPEGVHIADVASLYLQTNGVSGTTLWTKVSGVGNTGWTNVAVGTVTASDNWTASGTTNSTLPGTASMKNAVITNGITAGASTFTGTLGFTGTSSLLNMPSLTTAQKNAATAIAGSQVYDSDLGRVQAYDGAAWHSRVRLDGDTMTGTLTVTGFTNSARTASTFVVAAADKSDTSTATSAVLASTLTDETGTGLAVFNTAPSFALLSSTDILSGGYSVTRATLTHAGTVTLDCGITNRYASITLTGNVTFATANLAAGKWYNVIVTMTATNDTPTFPAWKWLGGAPSTLTASQIGVLSIYPTSTTDATTLAAYTETQ